MALIKSDKKMVQYSWDVKSTRKPRMKLPSITDRPAIDYDKLRLLCETEKLRDKNDEQSQEDFHNMFMENYQKLFVQPPKRHGIPNHSAKRGNPKNSSLSVSQKATGPTTNSEKKSILPVKEKEFSHDIRDYLVPYHKRRSSDHQKAFRIENVKILRKLLRKLPFERMSAENDKICSVLKNIPYFSENLTPNVLKELCVVAQLEVWKDSDFAVFGNTGLHLILKGSVQTDSNPYLITEREESTLTSLSSSTDVEQNNEPDTVKLSVGQCFGTLKKLEGKDPTCKELSVVTFEANCEFLKISTSDYKRVMEQIKQKEHTEKLNLILSCSQYSNWPRQPLLEVANLIEWMKYTPNTVLVSESYKSPFIAFIKCGDCHVLRQVEVLETLKNGQKEHKSKQVVIGKLGASNSFAELSVLLKEPMSCSIVTASAVELGIIKPERIQELDEVTVQLFKQSNTHLFGNLTKDDIHEEYMQQELKREWNEFKHHVVVDVINTRGIKPGYGKWAK
ncbi:cyclic nucleotide-binding domain-containing protein 1 isoform X1 [Patella vulgata]|uniref:cyclic nucleotide-binding domain-containing protein 1 isoform X1 n=2 Tax=Patella vulgata TaxID=6465 RepID=UPI00217FCA6D|nr:cyclic nucleotide-binding domain-containing protein 1 isoform X1 [Patella vulgata]